MDRISYWGHYYNLHAYMVAMVIYLHDSGGLFI